MYVHVLVRMSGDEARVSEGITSADTYEWACRNNSCTSCTKIGTLCGTVLVRLIAAGPVRNNGRPDSVLLLASRVPSLSVR